MATKVTWERDFQDARDTEMKSMKTFKKAKFGGKFPKGSKIRTTSDAWFQKNQPREAV